MKKITRQFLALLFFCAFSFSSLSQDEINTEFINRMNYVFSPLEKNRVPTGLLLDYAMEWADLKSYNGFLTDSNKVNSGLLKDVYTTVAMSAIHTNAGGFYSPDYIDDLWNTKRQPGIITLSGVYYNYSRFRDDAVNAGLINVSNDQFYDRYLNGNWQNPYQTETVFAMSPPLHAYSGRNFQVVLPSDLWFTNNAVAVSSLAVDFNDGAGYRTVTANQGISINYADTGTKTWVFRLTLTNGAHLYSHTEMKIEQEPNNYSSSGGAMYRFPRPGGPIFLTADDAFQGQAGQGWITVDYANDVDPVLNRHRLLRPLIVVEGFDPGHLLAPEDQFGESSFETFSVQLLRSGSNLRDLLQDATQEYDIIYVDWFRGTDFLQRNALLLERIIRWVNEQKALDGSTEPNVILGQSMGGVISRWALRDMENRGLNHQTRLFISWDAPQQGANIPIAYQHMNRHANNLFVQSAIPTLLGGLNVVRLARNYLNLIDVPSARQMLMNRALANGQIDNTEHEAWQQELRNLGYPQQFINGVPIRNIAVSNGSECGIGQGFQPNADLINVNGRANTRFLSELALGFFPQVWSPISILTLKPQFLLGILPGRNDFFFELNCKAQPINATSQIYKGKIAYRKKILYLVGVNTIITDRSRNSDPSVLGIDGSQGGMIDTEVNLENIPFQNWALKYNITASSIPHFNFIPTTSALDIGGGNTPLTLADHNARYIGETPPAFPLNSPFVNFTTAFNQVAVSNGINNNNENHIQISPRNGNWVAVELQRNPADPAPQTNCSSFCENGTIAGAEILCTSEIYTAPFGNGVTYTWSVDKPWLVTTSANINSFSVTANAGASGILIITVQITGACGNTVLTKQNISVGTPQIEMINFTNEVGGQGYWCSTHTNNLFSVEPSYLNNVTFEARLLNYPSMTVFRTNSFAQAGIDPFGYVPNGLYILQLRTSNACGTGPWNETEIEYVDCFNYGEGGEYFRVTASPNPTDGDLNVTIDKEKAEVKALKKTEKISYRMYNFNRTSIVREWTYDNSQNQHKLNVRGMQSGQYILVITKGKYQQSKQIMIK